MGEEKSADLVLDSSLVAIAHELKSPLCLVRQLSLFLSGDESLSQKEARQYLQQIVAVSERGLRLANDLARVGNLEQLEFNLEPLSPTEVCRQVAEEMAGYYEINQKRLVVRSQQRRHYLAMANYDLLKSVLVNFCDNALHYADQKHPVEINISLHKRPQKIRIAVRDYGPRLPLKVWRSLKGRQPIVPGTQSSRPLSSGLGLYLADQFASAMQASIGGIAHDDGATFFIDLDTSKQLSLLWSHLECWLLTTMLCLQIWLNESC